MAASEGVAAKILKDAFVETVMVDPRDCLATQSLRQIRQSGVEKLKVSFLDIGFLDSSKIMGNRLPPGGSHKYRIFEGNHRIVALQQMLDKNDADISQFGSIPLSLYTPFDTRTELLIGVLCNAEKEVLVPRTVLDTVKWIQRLSATVGNGQQTAKKLRIAAQELGHTLYSERTWRVWVALLKWLTPECMEVLERAASSEEVQQRFSWNSLEHLRKKINVNSAKVHAFARLEGLGGGTYSLAVADDVDVGSRLNAIVRRSLKAAQEEKTFMQRVNHLGSSTLGEAEREADAKGRSEVLAALRSGRYDVELMEQHDGLIAPLRVVLSRTTYLVERAAKAKADAEAKTKAAADGADESDVIDWGGGGLHGSDDSSSEDAGVSDGDDSGIEDGDDTGKGKKKKRSGNKRKADSPTPEEKAEKRRPQRSSTSVEPNSDALDAVNNLAELNAIGIFPINADVAAWQYAPEACQSTMVKTFTGNAELIIIDPVVGMRLQVKITSAGMDQCMDAVNKWLSPSGTALIFSEWQQLHAWKQALGKYKTLLADNSILTIVTERRCARRNKYTSSMLQATMMVLVVSKAVAAVDESQRNPDFTVPPILPELTGQLGYTWPPYTNVLDGYKPPPMSSRICNTSDNRAINCGQKHHALFRTLIRRYSKPRDWVIDMFAGSMSCGKAALLENRRYVGIEIDRSIFEAALDLLSSTCMGMKEAGWLGGESVSDELPADFDYEKIEVNLCPSVLNAIASANADSPLDRANAEASAYGLEIKTSTVAALGKGLFAKEPISKGDMLGYYWGRVVVGEPTVEEANSYGEGYKDRIVKLHKYVMVDGQARRLCIVGDIACALTYVNSPENISNRKCNTYLFEEHISKDTFNAERTDTKPSMSRLICIRAVRDLDAGEELWFTYGKEYFTSPEEGIESKVEEEV
jgi:DNA modification methylase